MNIAKAKPGQSTAHRAAVHRMAAHWRHTAHRAAAFRQRIWRTAPATLLAVLVLLPLSGCGGLFGASGGSADWKVIASTEKRRYEAALSEEIWSVKTGQDRQNENAGNEEKSFGEIMSDQVAVYLGRLSAAGEIAQALEIQLTEEEKRRCRSAAEAYLSALPEDQQAAMGVSAEQMTALYTSYALAEAITASLRQNPDLEVSESEARVMEVLVAEGTESEARALSAGVSEQGDDFASSATARGMNVSDRKIPADDPILRKAEGLSAGQVSEAVQTGEGWAVIWCVQDYLKEETAARKKEMEDRRVASAWRELIRQKAKPGERRGAGDIASVRYGTAVDFYAVWEDVNQ